MRWRGDMSENKKIVNLAMENNINYFETAPIYTRGVNELILADALKGIPRNQYRIATKLHIHLNNTYEDCAISLQKSLLRLKTDYIDYFLLHMLNKKLFLHAVDTGMLDFCDRMKKNGRIKFLGFSFHDNYNVFKQIISFYNWDLAQVRMNYLDDNSEATLHGIYLAGEQNIPVSVMQPLKGGFLVNMPNEMHDILQHSKVNQPLIRLALKWLSNIEPVKMILLGPTCSQQLAECCGHIDVLHNYKLTTEEIEIINKMKSIYAAQKKVDCTYCMYCNNVCPCNIPIGQIFMQYNSSIEGINNIKKMMPELNKISCIDCGKCESICPQSVSIRRYLVRLENLIYAGD